ncbi:MAG: hypothetical protein ACI8UO_005121, partial [Verrucomicrobiales bacterium]
MNQSRKESESQQTPFIGIYYLTMHLAEKFLPWAFTYN